MKPCNRPSCTRTTDHISGYCSDLCVQLEHDSDLPPLTVLTRNKEGGFGTSLAWQVRVPVFLPSST